MPTKEYNTKIRFSTENRVNWKLSVEKWGRGAETFGNPSSYEKGGGSLEMSIYIQIIERHQEAIPLKQSRFRSSPTNAKHCRTKPIPQRRNCFNLFALISGVGDATATLILEDKERRSPKTKSPFWAARQIKGNQHKIQKATRSVNNKRFKINKRNHFCYLWPKKVIGKVIF